VKLLLDENLSPRLVERLASLFPSIIHVRDIGLKQGSDVLLWQNAVGISEFVKNRSGGLLSIRRISTQGRR
jgi:predicted nuclease of predicted toxin-antitoxin system